MDSAPTDPSSNPVPAPAPEPANVTQAPAPAPAAAPAPAQPSAAAYESNPFKLIKPSLEAFKLCWLNVILLILSAIGVGILYGALVAALTAASPGVGVIAALVSLPVVLYGCYYLAWAITKATLEATRGRKTSFRETLPASLSAPWKLLATGLLLVLIIVIGFILLIVPGIIFLGWFGQSIYMVVDEGIWGVAALKRSRELARGRVPEVLGTFFLSSFFSILAIIPILGGLAALVLTLILIPVSAVRYNSLLALKSQPGWESTPINPLNYVVLILGFLGTSFSSNHNLQELQKNSTPSTLENNIKAY